MNATEKIFALALASNFNPKQHLQQVVETLKQFNGVQFSSIYVIPCRDGIGADYWNAACLFKANIAVDDMLALLKKMEADSGRIRPSHQITLDVDLIAWGEHLNDMQFNPKKLPLALDVKIPMSDLWQHPAFEHDAHPFPVLSCH
ncbi:2-amino-4-hydroxy-6-hydroxymethyldihydropteridine pyrophosphokinase [Acinetobacter sp. ANC 5054]|uniref:2-amino-4-hydroxy-6- hydroxymethyldihydropteridine diphosphokinase n=1 Tax=Acinetobacter sp. ANC 5054 TaxID=1977877 RepID=UPI000A343D42|nr:2-amino-4-hydroxy-6-hydroxymethyldihydropteridine diphosphokinase [Acinetobacter sp. ANC 5054]OTG77684.1 2-amino-4-hydroxy-6-hydroxymethyldihydropteridine pyrophosphokinase [Acinetobacter sp. ANC 5054]